MRTSQNTLETISTIGIDVGKNTFHLVGLDKRGAIVLQQKVTRRQLRHRLSKYSALPHRNGSLFWHPLHRATAYGSWSRCAFDPSAPSRSRIAYAPGANHNGSRLRVDFPPRTKYTTRVKTFRSLGILAGGGFGGS
jgi:hypothetical protein